MAPRVGLEPTTYRLTAECSTIELPWNTKAIITDDSVYYISKLKYMSTYIFFILVIILVVNSTINYAFHMLFVEFFICFLYILAYAVFTISCYLYYLIYESYLPYYFIMLLSYPESYNISFYV